MNYFEFYKQNFDLMDKLYFTDTDKYDEMGILLSTMDPSICTGESSADDWFFYEFERKLKELNKTEYKQEDGLKILIEIATTYEDCLDINQFLNDLKKLYNINSL